MAFQFLKKIFNKEPVEIELREVEVFNRFQDAKEAAGLSLSKEIDTFKKDYDNELNVVKHLLKELKDASLRNPNIPQRELDFMEGNRVAYMKKLVNIFKDVNLPESIDDIEIFHNELQRKLDDFTEQSYRAYNITSQFFGDEVSALGKQLKKIDALDKSFYSIFEDANLKKYSDIEKDINIYSRSEEIVNNIKEDIEDKQKQKKLIETQLEEAKEENKKFIDSEEYQAYSELNTSKAGIDNDISNLFHNFRTYFTSIEHPLKKFSKMAVHNTEWIDAYLEDPYDALKSDKSLLILDIISLLKQNVEQLKLNDKKKNKLLKTLDKMDDDFIKGFKYKLDTLEDKKLNTLEKIDSATVEETLQKLKKDIEDTKNKVKIIDGQIISLENDLDKIDRVHMRNKVIKEIEDLLEVKINIIE